jgi:integral membrane sensor domain MASE1
LTRFGPRLWPGIVVGDLLVANYSTPLGTVLGQTTGNTLEVLIAALLLRRLAGADVGLTRVVQVLALVVSAVVGTLVSACLGSASLRLGTPSPPRSSPACGGRGGCRTSRARSVVTPVILSWANVRPYRLQWRGALEGVVLLTGLVVVAAELPSQRDVPYIVFPLLIWAALRFGPRGASLALLLVSGLRVLNTAHNTGPFVRESITDSLLSTQLFLATAALSSLILAAVTAERATAATALRANEERPQSVVSPSVCTRSSARHDAGDQVDHRGQDHGAENVRQQAVAQRDRADGRARDARVGDLVGHAEVVAEVQEVAVRRRVVAVEVDPACGGAVEEVCIAGGVHQV